MDAKRVHTTRERRVKLYPANDFHRNEQTTWTVGLYTAYGAYTRIIGAIAAWAILPGHE